MAALFAALATKDGKATTTASSSTSLVPEAIQLHSHLRIDFINGATVIAHPSSSSASTAAATTTNSTANAIDLDIGGGSDTSRNAYSLLSYQAVQTQRQDDEYAPTATTNAPLLVLASERQKRRGHQDMSVRPDLGIWDCRIIANEDDENNDKTSSISSSSSLAAMLLRRVVLNNDRFKLSGGSSSSSSNNTIGDREEKKEETTYRAERSDSTIQQQNQILHPPPIVMVVDMSDVSEIQQQVERMKGVIVNIYDDNISGGGNDAPYDDGSGKSHTTSVRALKNTIFGSAAMINDPTSTPSSAPSTSEDKRIALILAVIVPPSTTPSSSKNAAEEYKERRARDLILYHLHKFSMEVDCTLCFVSREGGGSMELSSSSSEGGEDTNMATYLPSMSIDEFSKVIRRVALGLLPVEVDTIAATEDEEDNGDEAAKDDSNEDTPLHISRQRTPSIYAPGTHDAELINGVYLRNASCDGSWDAVTDDLNVALPPRSSSSGRPSAIVIGEERAKTAGNGDEEWLSELAYSMGISSDAASSSSAPAPSTTPKAEQPGKETKPAVKKRVTRASSSSTRDKDAKPKDQKEVMNFFGNLIKK